MAAPPAEDSDEEDALESQKAACLHPRTCAACRKVKSPAEDLGVRCVWCESLGACRPYVKGTQLFPCADAVRQGGGYPGGSKCPDAGTRAARAPVPSKATRGGGGGRGGEFSLLRVPTGSPNDARPLGGTLDSLRARVMPRRQPAPMRARPHAA